MQFDGSPVELARHIPRQIRCLQQNSILPKSPQPLLKETKRAERKMTDFFLKVAILLVSLYMSHLNITIRMDMIKMQLISIGDIWEEL